MSWGHAEINFKICLLNYTWTDLNIEVSSVQSDVQNVCSTQISHAREGYSSFFHEAEPVRDSFEWDEKMIKSKQRISFSNSKLLVKRTSPEITNSLKAFWFFYVNLTKSFYLSFSMCLAWYESFSLFNAEFNDNWMLASYMESFHFSFIFLLHVALKDELTRFPQTNWSIAISYFIKFSSWFAQQRCVKITTEIIKNPLASSASDRTSDLTCLFKISIADNSRETLLDSMWRHCYLEHKHTSKARTFLRNTLRNSVTTYTKP